MSAAVTRLLHFTQRHLLWLLLLTYAAGALAPSAGLRLRAVHFGVISLPMLMLGSLLVVAGLGADLAELRHLVRRPWMLVTGFLANATYPIAFAAVISLLLVPWHNPDEAQSILVGLAMIGAMPIAGSSTAWSQNADGNLALSLGLVWASTLLSPLVTPLGLHLVGFLARGDYSEDLHELAQQGSTQFVTLAVLLPSLIGVAARALLRRWVARLLPALKLVNLIVLLALNYSNAAITLPQTVTRPDWDFLALAFAITAIMCIGAFAAGWLIPRLFRADRADRTSLMFGLGMNNNGTGLVLAAAALADHKLVLVPIILYNLVQQLVAGMVDALRRRSRGAVSSTARSSG